jgi:serine/threonine-protein kinase
MADQRGAVTEEELDPPIASPIEASTHPGFATTALGPADVRDTPRVTSSAVTEPDAWVGRVLSNVYRVEGKIGEGGMGAVYAARHVHLHKQYAVKVLSSSVAKTGNAIERLKQEAIAASSIDHDNIVDVTNFDTYEDGSVFIVMELLRGESLAARIARGPIVAHETVKIAQQVCGALGAAHARGIVHRDLKPENVFLSIKAGAERVKVLDFGISKVKSAEAEGVRMTRTGQLVGTPLYMSPEQARGEVEVDRRVDIYALGVMLYEMLTGVPPFEGRNYFELLWKHGNEAPMPIAARNSNVFLPEKLGAVVMRALAKEREQRFQTMEELATALHEALPDVAMAETAKSATPTPSKPIEREPTGERALPAAPPKSHAPIFAGVGVVVLLAIVGLAWNASSTPRATPVATTVEPAIEHAVTPPPPPTSMAEAPPPGVEPPPFVTVSFGSTPSGAEVRHGDAVLCTTPCMQDLPRGEQTIVFHRDGFFDETAHVTPDEGTPVLVRLRPRRRAPETGATTSIKTEI